MNLYEKVKDYCDKNNLRFHTPLHKGRDPFLNQLTLKFDVTEVGEFDNLMCPTGLILKIKEKSKEIFSCEEIFLITHGGTVGNFMSIYLLKDQKIGIFRSAHKSVYSSLKFLNCDFVVLNDFKWWSEKKPVPVAEVKEFLTASGVKGLLLTSPSYYGVSEEVEKISQITKKMGVTLALDEAHGSHFYFSDSLKSQGKFSDFFTVSLHKTLPCLTGSAAFNVNNEKFLEKAREAFSLFHSTSPFYPTLISMEHTFERVEEIKRDMSDLFGKVEHLKANLKRENVKFLENHDFSRLVILCHDGFALQKHLNDNGIFEEFSDTSSVTLLLSIYDTEEDFKRLFAEVVKWKEKFEIKKSASFQPIQKSFENGEVSEMPKQVSFEKNQREERALQETQWLELSESAGKKSACNFGLYPPCFPLVLEGEIISKEVTKLFESHPTRFYGVENGKVKVFV